MYRRQREVAAARSSPFVAEGARRIVDDPVQVAEATACWPSRRNRVVHALHIAERTSEIRHLVGARERIGGASAGGKR